MVGPWPGRTRYPGGTFAEYYADLDVIDDPRTPGVDPICRAVLSGAEKMDPGAIGAAGDEAADLDHELIREAMRRTGLSHRAHCEPHRCRSANAHRVSGDETHRHSDLGAGQ